MKREQVTANVRNRLNHHQPMLDALLQAERKLKSYIGVCDGDKELVECTLPQVQDAIKKALELRM